MKITHTSRCVVDALPHRLLPPHVEWIRLNPNEFLPNGNVQRTLEFRGFLVGKPRRKYPDCYDRGMDIPDYTLRGDELRGIAPNGLLEEFSLRDCADGELDRVIEALEAKTVTLEIK